jgi:CRISPR system Cascade subunit CasE
MGWHREHAIRVTNLGDTMFESLIRFTPQDPARAARTTHDRGHQLIWSLFAQNGTARDFLYQPIPGYPFSAVVRSSRSPQVVDGWSVTTRAFAPHLKVGQDLAFRLEAVPFRWKRTPGARRGKREDLVTAMRRMHAEARQSPEVETALIHSEAARWFTEQGTKQGFAIDNKALAVSVYDQEIRGRPGDGSRCFRFTSFVYEGHLQVTNAEQFRTVLHRGVGAEKAFGFGLIQIAPLPTGSIAV